MELGQDESRKDEDRAFILRLPPERAREVRQLLADNNLGALRINVEPTRAGPQQTTFRGRTGTLSMPAAAGGTDRLPLTVLDMPTLLEAYSTIDGKGGDYVKAADVSQLMVVHESDAEANALRSRRPSGRAESGITPPTYKITREFLRRKPHFASLLRLRKFNLKSTFNAIQRAERHILRVQSKGGGAPAAAVSDTEVEEIEVEDDGEKDDRLDLGDNVDIGSGGGEPYKAVDGDTYYSKNGRAYRQETNERVGFFASKVRFKLRMRPSGVYCTQAECDMPAALLLPDHQRPADYDAEQKFEGDLEKDMENEENPVDMPQPQDQEEDQMLIDDIEDNLDMEEEAQDGDAVGPNGTPPDGGEHELDAGFVEGDPTAEVEDWLNEGMGTATVEAAEPEVLAPDDEGVDEVGAPRAADDEMIVDGEPPASPQGGNIDDTGLWQADEGMAVMNMSTQDEALPEEGAQAIQLLPDDAVTHAIPGQYEVVGTAAGVDIAGRGDRHADQQEMVQSGLDSAERERLQGAIASCREKLREINEGEAKVQDQVSKAPNPVMKQRLQKQLDAYIEQHAASRAQLEAQLAQALDELGSGA